MKTQVLEFSWYSILQAVLLGALCFFVFFIRDIILLLIVAFIVSSGMIAGSTFLQKKTFFSYEGGVVTVYFFVLGLFGFLFTLLVPAISTELQSLVTNLPQLLGTLDQWLATLADGRITSLQSLVGDNVNFSRYTWQAASGVFFTTQGVIAGIVYFGFILITTFHMAFDPRSLEDLVVFFFPDNQKSQARSLLVQSRQKVGNWLVGQMIVASILGTLSYVALILLGVPYALLLAVLAGFLNMIPFLGPILALVPATFFALLQSIQVALIVVVIYIGLQNLEGNFLTPVVMNKVTGLSPIVVLISIILGASLAGALGALIAIPVVSVVSLFVKDLSTDSTG